MDRDDSANGGALLSEADIRGLARKHRYILCKPSPRESVAQMGYMLITADTKAVVLGEHFDASRANLSVFFTYLELPPDSVMERLRDVQDAEPEALSRSPIRYKTVARMVIELIDTVVCEAPSPCSIARLAVSDSQGAFRTRDAFSKLAGEVLELYGLVMTESATVEKINKALHEAGVALSICEQHEPVIAGRIKDALMYVKDALDNEEVQERRFGVA